jgi:hypothetical protein
VSRDNPLTLTCALETLHSRHSLIIEQALLNVLRSKTKNPQMMGTISGVDLAQQVVQCLHLNENKVGLQVYKDDIEQIVSSIKVQ